MATAKGLWAALPRVVMATGGSFSSFCKSVIFAPVAEDEGAHPPGIHRRPEQSDLSADGTTPWPMAPPFPQEFAKPEAKRKRVHHQRTAINMITMLFSWLSLGEVSVAPASCRLGAPLSPRQWREIDGLRSSVGVWSRHPAVDVGDLGRMADKAVNYDQQVSLLQNAVDAIRQDVDVYALRKSNLMTFRQQQPFGRDPGTVVVGTAAKSDFNTTKSVKCDRLKFHGTPTFDPRPYLVDTYKDLFDHPSLFQKSPDGPVPRVQVRASRRDFVRFLELLDRTGRLLLRPASDSDPQKRVGLHAVYKDADWDRLILDARPANLHEAGFSYWVKHLGAASILLEIVLDSDEALACYGDDLRDFYHVFQVSYE